MHELLIALETLCRVVRHTIVKPALLACIQNELAVRTADALPTCAGWAVSGAGEEHFGSGPAGGCQLSTAVDEFAAPSGAPQGPPSQQRWQRQWRQQPSMCGNSRAFIHRQAGPLTLHVRVLQQICELKLLIVMHRPRRPGGDEDSLQLHPAMAHTVQRRYGDVGKTESSG